MALPLYLQQIKSSGMYRFVWDKSVSTEVNASTLRLCVGYSEKGPFNTPVYISTTDEFKQIFGGVSRRLEKKGIFFHRMCLQALAAGPILALNLKRFSSGAGDVFMFDPATEALESPTSKKTSTKFSDTFDTTRFWTINPQTIIANNTVNNEYKYINIVSTGNKNSSCTIVMRPALVDGYNITAKQYYALYSSEEMPEFLKPDSLMSDYFAEVYVFRGEITPELAQSEMYSKYFDVTTSRGVTTVSFKSYIVNSFNERVDALSSFASMEGNGFVGSYVGSLIPDFKNAQGVNIALNNVFNLDNNVHNMYMTFNDTMLVDYEGTASDEKINVHGGVKFDLAGSDVSIVSNATTLPMSLSKIDIAQTSNVETSETKTEGETSTTTYYWKSESLGIGEAQYTLYVPTTTTSKLSLTTSSIVITEKGLFIDTIVKGTKLLIGTTASVEVVEVTNSIYDEDRTKQTISFAMSGDNAPTYFAIVNDESKITTHYGATTPTYVCGYTDLSLPATNSQYAKLTFQNDSIYGALVSTGGDDDGDYTGIRIALTDRKSVDYRYIVDTCESCIGGGAIKVALFDTCRTKQNAYALVNFPFMSTFTTDASYAKYFKDPKRGFKMAFVKQGSVNPSLSYVTLNSDEGTGASFGSYYTSVRMRENGSTAFDVPSAALVSNEFMKKYTTRLPYEIVAGPNYGRVTYSGLIGPDFNFSREDLDVLEPWGVNALVYVPQKGTYINSNQTAKQTPVSTLSKTNVRELVIYIQDEVELILGNYQWEFNTVELRDTIKTKIDTLLERIKSNGGLYTYKTVCDETNNTDDVINNEMLVVSISIEPGMGAGKMVQELTLYRKGGMSMTTNA